MKSSLIYISGSTQTQYLKEVKNIIQKEIKRERTTVDYFDFSKSFLAREGVSFQRREQERVANLEMCKTFVYSPLFRDLTSAIELGIALRNRLYNPVLNQKQQKEFIKVNPWTRKIEETEGETPLKEVKRPSIFVIRSLNDGINLGYNYRNLKGSKVVNLLGGSTLLEYLAPHCTQDPKSFKRKGRKEVKSPQVIEQFLERTENDPLSNHSREEIKVKYDVKIRELEGERMVKVHVKGDLASEITYLSVLRHVRVVSSQIEGQAEWEFGGSWEEWMDVLMVLYDLFEGTGVWEEHFLSLRDVLGDEMMGKVEGQGRIRDRFRYLYGGKRTGKRIKMSLETYLRRLGSGDSFRIRGVLERVRDEVKRGKEVSLDLTVEGEICP